MKAILFALFVGLLMVGCGEPESNAIEQHSLEKRGPKGEERYYEPNEETPYTGWAKEMWRNGQMKTLSQYIDGNLEGLVTSWYENGQKNEEKNYKAGKQDGLTTSWYENGQKNEE